MRWARGPSFSGTSEWNEPRDGPFDPLLCPQSGGMMRISAFLTDYPVVDKIINHLKLAFVSDRPPPPHLIYQEVFMAIETASEYLSSSSI